MTTAYDYLFLTLKGAAAAHAALAKSLRESAGPALAAAGGEVVGQFAPQLGWANNEAAVLVRWSGAPGDLTSIIAAEPVATARLDRLTPTLRPADATPPMPGGIYVHRWFEVPGAAADEFVELSGEGWKRFEALFDTRIYGLLKSDPSPQDTQAGAQRLLLLTRYGDHGVWEASRDPSTEAMQIFARRQQLTRRSWAASTRLVPAA
jgi:hypothetical protein